MTIQRTYQEKEKKKIGFKAIREIFLLMRSSSKIDIIAWECGEMQIRVNCTFADESN